MMKKKNFKKIATDVVEKEIIALKKLKSYLNNNFNLAVETIINCKNGRVIISGVGKSAIIGQKISATLSSTGTPSFFLDPTSANHGDMGKICSNDVLILISLSGKSAELKNIIQFASRNKKIHLIGITANKESLLYKNSDVKLLIPKTVEADPGNIVPTSSTIIQLSLGDALAVACMNAKKFGKLDFKKYHPSGSLAVKLKTVGDLMLTGNKIPFINHNKSMKDAIKIINEKKIGSVIVRNKSLTVGLIVDGDIKRVSQKNKNLHDLKVKNIMTKNPISVDKDMLAAKALSIMNSKKITILCVQQKNKKKTIGIIHIHHILNADIN